MKQIPLLLLSLLLLLSGCEWIFRPYGYKYPNGDLPDDPVNLEEFNTEYDDYNSTAPTLGWLIPFCFSTNRQSQGGEFDVIYQPMNVSWSKTTGELNVYNEYLNWLSRSGDYSPLVYVIPKIRTEGNELGPNLVIDTLSDGFRFTLMYATDSSGDFDIYFSSNLEEPEFSDPLPVSFLNSAYDDLYPTLNHTRDRIMFCSDRENGNFDIYYVDIPDPDLGLDSLLSDPASLTVQKDEVLSGPGEDKCPFIFGNLLVFASDRSGGYGGFDLYYSKLEQGNWSEPVNFGPRINTEANEYRPILIEEGVTREEIMMVFSSDREGGMGGYDLWFAGVNPE